jgi:uncharacterized protein YfiM (DUF2279 family)
MQCFAMAIATALAVFVAAGGARATETVGCAGMDDSSAVVTMNVGVGLPAELPNWVRVEASGKTWSTLDSDVADGATPVGLYQAFDDRGLTMIDLSDRDVTEILISIRILSATEGARIARAGTLHVRGTSVYPILCDSGDSE